MINYGQHEALFTTLTYPMGASASGTVKVKTGVGALCGIMVTAVGNTPTLTVYDNVAGAGTAIFANFTPVAATLYRLDLPVRFQTGLTVISTGSVGCTISYY